MSKQNRNKKARYKKNIGSKYGPWVLIRKIGAGGNGEVWEVSRRGFPNHALKLLKSIKQDTYDRFKSEISVLSDNQDIEGLIPLIDKNESALNASKPPWFVMPIATEFKKYNKGKTPLELAADFVELAETLEILHSRGISHRDIKPANILFLKNRLNFSDFGLVKYPSREDFTKLREDVGAKYTMAPEMRRHAHKADGLAADVYSFSKTLWIALTGQATGFDGQYKPNSILGLKSYLPDIYTGSLDSLLVEATDNDPKQRPNIKQFYERLSKWIELNNDFQNRNLTEWFEIQNILFPISSPQQSSWSDIDSVCAVLTEISQVKSLHHMFYPSGGGNTITGVSKAAEPGMITLHIGDKMVELLKPKKLTYESFGLDPEWNYFRLEAEVIEPTGIKNSLSSDGMYEALTELEPGVYADINCWEYNEYNGQPLPEISRPATRYLNGSFVFFCTSSTYNHTSSTYDARHNKMSEDEFREYIKRNCNHLSRKSA